MFFWTGLGWGGILCWAQLLGWASWLILDVLGWTSVLSWASGQEWFGLGFLVAGLI
jgi:hypothetical protein